MELSIKEDKPLDPDTVDWKNLKHADSIYPSFLTPHDKKIRLDKSDLIEVRKGEIKERKSDYDTISKFGIEINPSYYIDNDRDVLIPKILNKISHIPNMLIAGGYALAKFDRTDSWNDVDIFTYGPDSLEHILEGVSICLEMVDPQNIKRLSKYGESPIRTKYAISIPVHIGCDNDRYFITIQFILMKFETPSHILNAFDVDSSCISMKISNLNKFYALPRFVRAFETRTNMIDPAHQSHAYIERLIKYSMRGFDIAIPGFNKSKLRINPDILRDMMTEPQKDAHKAIMDRGLSGLESLVVSSVLGKDMANSKHEVDVYSGRITELYSVLKSCLNSKCKKYFSYDDDELQIKEHFGDLTRSDGTLSFVVCDVLNEGDRDFMFGLQNRRGIVKYTPKYPRIELTSDPQGDMIKESFYGKYYSVE